MAEEKAGLEIDDWLDDLAEDKPAPAQEFSGEMDQSDIDSLLGGGAAASGPAPADDGGELDQSDIDALLGGGGAAPVSAAGGGGEGFSELDQSDIDSLLGGGEGPTVAAAPAVGDDFDLDQSDIDGLFASAGEKNDSGGPAMADDLGPPSKDDLDSLFSDIGGEGVEQPETVSFAEVAQDGGEKAGAAASGEDNFGLPDDGGFDDDEFDFGDLPDIPDEATNSRGTAPQAGMGEEDIFATASPVAAMPDFLAEATMDNSRGKPSASSGADHPFAPPPKAGKKKSMAVAVFCLVLLAGGGGYFFMKNKKGEMPVPVPPPAQEKTVAVGEGPPPVVVGAPVAPLNVAPVANESRWRMTKPNEALPVELSGTDENNDPLKFEIVTPPKFGRLSGDMPKITYLPNKDFPGEDSFEFRVSDGQLASGPAKVGVMGPEEVKPVAAEAPKELPPEERPVVAAANMRLKTLSTAPLTINWKKIWAAANTEPFGAKVSVEILGGLPLRGALHRLDSSRHRYEPDRYFGGKEEIRYRFKAAGVYSKAGKLTITVKPNDKPPVLVLRPMSDSYKVGENVVLDAGLTRDDSPGGVCYSWEQLAGPPVYMEQFHGQVSAVSFVVPSSFRGEQKTRIIIRVTAIDPGGQRASREIGITPVSKRQTALWGIPE